MRATHLLLALPGLALLLCPQPAPPGPSPSRIPPACKPLAPIVVQVVPRGDGAGPVVTLDVAVRPLLAMQDVHWAWDLSPGVSLLEGEAARAADPGRDALTEDEVELSVPTDGRFARARLVVTGTFIGLDDQGVASEETVQVVHDARWGARPEPGVRVQAIDAATGERVEMLAVPSAHRAGR
jgi:hypothetical protein